MRYAIINGATGPVVNVAEGPASWAGPGGGMTAIASTTANIGDTWTGTAFTPAAVPAAPVPTSVSRRQFFQQLAVQGLITNSEALAALSGTIPSELATLISGLPSAQQFAAQMLVSGATEFDRNNSFTLAIGAAYGLSSPQLDALWTAANVL